ncbi:DUF1700 domain-containing protein [Neobacillus sp. Marseille-QA0830]
MNKEEMLQELDERLKGLPLEDRVKLVELYKDLMEVANENRLADPKLSATLEDTYPLPSDTEKDPYRNMGRIILASLSLFFFNLIFVLGPVLAIFGVYLSLCIVAICFVLSPLFVLTQVFMGGFTNFELFLSLIVCGVGVALGAGMAIAGKGFYKLLSKYVNWNSRLIKGE